MTNVHHGLNKLKYIFLLLGKIKFNTFTMEVENIQWTKYNSGNLGNLLKPGALIGQLKEKKILGTTMDPNPEA